MILASSLLFVFLFATTILWFLNYHWSRRHLYKWASRVKGPKHYPFFGVSLPLLRNPDDFVNILMGWFNGSPNIFKAWFGNELIFGISNPGHAETIMNNPHAYSKWMHMYKSLRTFGGNGLITGPVHIWKRHRKILNPAFNQKILNGFMEVFVENCKNLSGKMDERVGQGEFDMTEIIYKHNLDVTCESIMGVKVNAQTTNSTYHRVFERLLDIALLRMIHIWYNLDLIFPHTKLYVENCQLHQHLLDFTNKVIKAKRDQYELKKNNNNILLEAQMDECVSKCKAMSEILIEETSFTEEEVRDEVITFIMAGSDTTTAATGFTLLMMAMHPEIQQKVLDEVLGVMGPDREVEPNDISYLKYTEQVIKESLRLFPPVSFIFRTVDNDVQLDDKVTLPTGCGIIFGILAIHRSPVYWPDPLKFDPDRFLPEEVAKRHPYAFIPFSGGPRNCIGYRFALMAIKTVVATVVRKYKLSTSYKSVADVELRANIVLKTRNGFNLSLEKR